MPHATNVDDWACQNRMCARACGLMRGRRRCERAQFVKNKARMNDEKSDRKTERAHASRHRQDARRKRDGRRTGARHITAHVDLGRASCVGRDGVLSPHIYASYGSSSKKEVALQIELFRHHLRQPRGVDEERAEALPPVHIQLLPGSPVHPALPD